ncbi:MAG: fructosamine kinase family protein, partial [Gammaproteobacteria bacterium]|nr:fructosamine kinase family protein [Gammaproteobacteria bacterium]
MGLWEELSVAIGQATGMPFNAEQRSGVGGGCINSAFRIGDGSRRYFVKLNSANYRSMFEAEFAGLQELASCGAIRIPEPIVSGEAAGQAYLVTENITMGGSGDPAQFGRQLAQMHQSLAPQFGWYRNNTIGATPQMNEQEDDWITFLQRHRFGYQLQLAHKRSDGRRIYDLGQQLVEVLGQFFSDYRPTPSLLHGDLWSGNYAYSDQGEAVIFDPAVYYGDREADIAMTEL